MAAPGHLITLAELLALAHAAHSLGQAPRRTTPLTFPRRGPHRIRAGRGDDDTDFLPGDGPTSGISVSLTAGTLHAIRERVGKRGVSAFLEKAAQRQIERDNLDELITDFEKANGPADPKAVAAKRAELTGSSPSSDAGASA